MRNTALALGLIVCASFGCADHGDCVAFSTCSLYNSEVDVTTQDAVTAAPVAVTFTVNGAAYSADCRCAGCLEPGYTGPCGEWGLGFTSTSTDEQTYHVDASAPGYAPQSFTVTVDYGNYQCASSSCPAAASPSAQTLSLQPES
jgi:hypothetical protein